jgi:rod shape determining protein RodA
VETLRRNFRELDFTLIGVLLLLAVYSFVALLAATHGKEFAPNVPSHIVSKQTMFELIGLAALFFTMVYDYRSLRKIRWWIGGFVLFLLVVVFAMPRVQGAHSWIPLPLFNFQPSEFAKLAMIIVIAGFMSEIDESEFPDYRPRKVWPILLMFVIPFGLVLKEPALGQALVLAAIAGTMYTVFAKRSHFFMIVAVMVITVVGLSVVALMFPTESTTVIDFLVKHHVLKSFQADRITTWLNPDLDPLGAGYNIRLAQTAVGSGQVFGEGLFGGIETKGNWIPNQWTDYIFTAIGEEFGFVGSSLLVLLFLFLIYRLVRIAATSQDTFGTYLVIGIVGMFAFQVFENIGMDMYLSPSTGITLPFISYGGSSLIANYIAVGLTLSVALRRKKLRFS